MPPFIRNLMDVTSKHYFRAGRQPRILPTLPIGSRRPLRKIGPGLPVVTPALMLVITGRPFSSCALLVYRQRAPLAITLALLLRPCRFTPVFPIGSIVREHHHWFGYWYRHDMFTPPFPGPDGNLTLQFQKLRQKPFHGT